MQKFQDVVLDSQGRPVAGAVIAVQSYPGGSPATVYQTDAIGAAYVPTTDSFGGFFFYAPDGNYSYTVTVGGVLRKTVTDVGIVDTVELESDVSGKAALTGGTFSGNIGVGSTAPSVFANALASGQEGRFSFLTDNFFRWQAIKTNASEIGANTGSHFEINRYSDAGGYLGTVIYALRTTGIVAIGTRTTNASGAKLQTVDGLTFPSTPSLSGDANTLDTYAESTWTPTDVSGAGLSLTTSDCVAVRIGRFVHVQGGITFPVTANASQAQIGGLPFSTRAATRTAIEIGGFTDSTFDLSGHSVAGTNAFFLYARGTNTALTNTQLSNRFFFVNAVYQV